MNEIYGSFEILEIKQETGEKLVNYYSHLRRAVVKCNCEDLADQILCDKIIQSLAD